MQSLYCFSRSYSLLLSLELTAYFLPETNIKYCIFPLSQEAVVQYEQYEQEVKNLQRLIEEAYRIIQDRPVSTSNIQELQAQIRHHEVTLSFIAFGTSHLYILDLNFFLLFFLNLLLIIIGILWKVKFFPTNSV